MDTIEIRDYNSLKNNNNNDSFVRYSLQLDLNLIPGNIANNIVLRECKIVRVLKAISTNIEFYGCTGNSFSTTI